LKYSVRKGKKTLNGKAIHWNILKIIWKLKFSFSFSF
jgi:hypothetical protein